MKPRLLLLLAQGFEEIETVVPIDLLRRGGVEVILAALTDELVVRGGQQMAVVADATLEEVENEPFDALFLPGGAVGVDNLLADPRIGPLVQRWVGSGKLVAAICAAPKVLAAAGVLQQQKTTSHPAVRSAVEPLSGAYSEERVVLDGALLTSRGPGTAAEFAFELLGQLRGEEVAAQLRRETQFR